MTAAMRLLVRVIQRRVAQGDVIDTVLEEYSRLTMEEKAQVRQLVHADRCD